MKRYLRTFATLLIALLASTAAKGQGSYFYSSIPQAEGLSEYVQYVMMDRHDGFVWFATRSGVGRYDGYDSKKYLDINAQAILEDAKGGIWVLSRGGIFRYDRQKDEFAPFADSKGAAVRSLSYALVDDGFLIGGIGSIFKYSYATEQVEYLCQIAGDDRYEVSEILEWDRGHALIGSRGKETLLVDLSSGNSFRSTIKDDDARALLKDHEGNIWISPYNKGVKCYDPSGKLLHFYDSSNTPMQTDIVLDMEECGGEIWVATDGDGVYIINTASGVVGHESHVPGNPSSLPAKSITHIHANSSEEFWLGTVRHGLVRIKKSFFQTFGEAAIGTGFGLSNPSVLSIAEDSDGKVWIGTDGGGVNTYDPSTGRFSNIQSTSGDKITSMTEALPGMLMIVKYGEGLFIMDKATGAQNHVLLVDEKTDARLCRSGSSIPVYKDTPSTIIILTREPYLYNLQNRQFTPITSPDNAKLEGFVHVIGNDPAYTYICDENKIMAIKRGESQLKTIFKCPENKAIATIERDSRGAFWVGGSFGFGRVEEGDEDITVIPCEFFKSVSSINDDGKGVLWLGAEQKLISYRMSSGEFTLYSESDGVAVNNYHSRASLLSSSGDLFLGGSKGLLKIEPRQSRTATGLSSIVLEDLKVAGKKPGFDGKRALKVSQSDSPIEIEVFARSSDLMLLPMYRYTVKGRKTNDISYSMSPWLTLSSLKPGKYKVLASCSTRYGGWSEDFEVLSLKVHAPWYRSWWFILFALAFLAGVLWSAYKALTRRESEKMKLAMEEHELKAEQEKIDFLINIDHELRTPLTLIEAPVKQLLKTMPKSDDRYILLENIRRQGEKMKNMLDMVLDVGRIEQIRDTVSEDRVDIHEWLSKMVEDFTPEASDRKVTIEMEPCKALGDISMDRKKSASIMSNFIMNALKYSPENGKITISAENTDDDMVRFKVVDEGEGLKNVDMDRLFSRFYQGKKSKPGTGIGLAYCKLLVDQQGGRIGASDNSPKKGSTFWFDLPRKSIEGIALEESQGSDIKKADASSQESPLAEDKVQNTLENISVLLVDDSEDLLQFLSDNLWPYCDKIFTATNGVEALRIIRSTKLDVVISDVHMPGMDGFELCRIIKNDMEISHIPIIMLTSMTDEDSKQFSYKSGADAYVSKPFDIDTLKYVVAGILDNRRRTVEKYASQDSMPSPVESTFSSADEEFLFKIDKTIEENLDNPELNVNLLCEATNINRATLYSKLKALANMGANDYITKTRISAAALMLKTTDLKISDVAEKTGFATQRYFSTVFKQYMGCTPSEFRSRLASESGSTAPKSE